MRNNRNIRRSRLNSSVSRANEILDNYRRSIAEDDLADAIFLFVLEAVTYSQD